MILLKKIICIYAAVVFILLCIVPPLYARVITQITPTLTITEEYNDNYHQNDVDTFEEWTTTYELGFTMGFLNRKSQIYLGYSPEYKDYKNQDNRDSFDQNVSLSAAFQPTKFTDIQANLYYDGHNGNNEGDSWEHSAILSIDSQLTKTLNAFLSQDYSQSFDQQVRTGDYKEHQTNTTQIGINKKFGAKNSFGLDFTYEFDIYNNSDDDEYKSYEPSAYFKYWLTRLDGLETNLEYTKKEFEIGSENDDNTFSGDIRYIRKFSRHLDGYIKYRQYLSNKEDGDHLIYHPSVGIDWNFTQDSGISVGIGILFHEWDNENEDSQDPFIDFNAYKVFKLSPRGSLSITGSSTYEESSEEVASLGYNISYQAGFSLEYQLTRRLSSSLFGSYKIQDFQEDDVNRQDDTADIGGGLFWSPLKWLQFSLNASHKNFNSDDTQREDYKENKITFFVRITPEKPIIPDDKPSKPSKKSLDEELFDK